MVVAALPQTPPLLQTSRNSCENVDREIDTTAGKRIFQIYTAAKVYLGPFDGRWAEACACRVSTCCLHNVCVVLEARYYYGFPPAAFGIGLTSAAQGLMKENFKTGVWQQRVMHYFIRTDFPGVQTKIRLNGLNRAFRGPVRCDALHTCFPVFRASFPDSRIENMLSRVAVLPLNGLFSPVTQRPNLPRPSSSILRGRMRLLLFL